MKKKENRELKTGKHVKLLSNLASVYPDPKIEIFSKVFKYISKNQIKGDYVEFGVAEGRSLIIASCNKKMRNLQDMRIIGYDSFKGMPKNTGIDKENELFNEGEFFATQEDVRNNLKKFKVDTSKITLIGGWFKYSLKVNRFPHSTKICIAYLDCDIYQSTAEALDFLTGRLVDGAILVFDEWFYFKGRSDKGQQRAFWKWIAKNTEYQFQEFHNYGWKGKSFIINKYKKDEAVV